MILPYDELEELYNPQLCDPVKREFRQDSTSEELAEYFKVWFRDVPETSGQCKGGFPEQYLSIIMISTSSRI